MPYINTWALLWFASLEWVKQCCTELFHVFSPDQLNGSVTQLNRKTRSDHCSRQLFIQGHGSRKVWMNARFSHLSVCDTVGVSGLCCVPCYTCDVCRALLSPLICWLHSKTGLHSSYEVHHNTEKSPSVQRRCLFIVTCTLLKDVSIERPYPCNSTKFVAFRGSVNNNTTTKKRLSPCSWVSYLVIWAQSTTEDYIRAAHLLVS